MTQNAISDDGLNDRVDALFADWTKGTRPGGAVAILLHGELLLQHCYGFADIEKSVRFAADKQFCIASITKQFTTACILILERQGKLRLDDEVAKLFPELGHLPGTMTLRHLCENSSGIRDYISLATLAGGQLLQGLDRQLIWKIICSQQTLAFQPGEQYEYSNSNFVILARVVEKFTGLSFEDALQKFLFSPLGMLNTELIAEPSNPPHSATVGYAGDIEIGYRPWSWDTHMSGEGGIWSTLDDMIIWERALIEDRVGFSGLEATLIRPGVLNTGEESCYGLGIETGIYRGARFAGHSGGFDGYRSYRIHFADAGLSVILFANHTVDPIALSLQVAHLFMQDFGDRSTRSEAQAPVASIDSRMGFYQGKDVGASCELSCESNQLTLEIMGAKRILSRQIGDRWMTGGTSLWSGYLEFDAEDPDSVVLRVAAGDRQRLRRDASWSDSVAAFCGDFYSVELDASYCLIEQNEELMLSCEGMAGEFRDVRLRRRGRASFSPLDGQSAAWSFDIGAMLYFQDTNTLLVSTHGAVGIRFERQQLN